MKITHITLNIGEHYVAKEHEEVLTCDFSPDGKTYHLIIEQKDVPVSAQSDAQK